MPLKPVDTAIKIILGPCIDDTDYKTREEALTYDQAGMEIDIILEKADGTITTTAVTPTMGGDYDWAHTDQGYYELELPASGGASYNNDAEGVLNAVGYCTGVLPFRSVAYDVVPIKVYNSFVPGSDNLEVDVIQLGGATQSATDLKDFADDGYDPNTDKVQGVVLVDTCTANSDMRGTDGANTTVPDAAGTAAALHATTDGKIDTNKTELDGMQGTDGKCAISTDAQDLSGTLDVNTKTIKGSDATNQIRDAIIDDATRIDASALNTLSGYAPDNTIADIDDVSGLSTLTQAQITGGAYALDTDANGRIRIVDGTGAGEINTNGGKIVEVETLTGQTPQTGDSFIRLGVPVGASISADVAAVKTDTGSIEADTQDIQNQIGIAGAGLTDLGGMSNGMKAEIESECSDALTSYDPPTKAEMDNGFAALNDITAADVWAYATRVLTAATNITSDGNTIDQTKIANMDQALSTTESNIRGADSDDLKNISNEIDTVNAKTTNLPADPASEATILASIAALNNISVADIIAGIADGTYDLQEMMRLIFAACCCKSSGGGTATLVFRDSGDSKDRITATVDGNGNRTAMTLDAS